MRRRQKVQYDGVLNIPAGTSDKVTIRHIDRPAGTTLQVGNFRTAIYGQAPGAVTFETPTRWHELSEEGQGVWMTDLPIEQKQCDDAIVPFRGRVLVGGLGLGYAVVALSVKPGVKSITVVERSEDVAELVWPATVKRVKALANADWRDAPELRLETGDLHEYLEALPSKGRHRAFSWGFYDIWQSDGETTFHETVVPLRRQSVGRVNHVMCWNEDIMRGQLFSGLRTKMMLLSASKEADAAAGAMIAAGAFGKMLTLDDLCQPHNMWMDWAIPFWVWYRDFGQAMPTATVDWVMARYASHYGLTEHTPYLPEQMAEWIHQSIASGVA